MHEIRFKQVETDAEYETAKQWMAVNEKQPNFDFKKNSNIYAAIRDKKIIAVFELINKPVLSMSFDRAGNVHQTIRAFDMMRAAMDIMNIRPIAVVDHESPLVDCAKRKMTKIDCQYYWL